jgi:CRISPR-associated endonuclease/helicase Cas3
MRGRPGAGDLWGKFRDENRGGPAWHPLIDHCMDVACVLEALLHQPTIRRRLARAGGLDDLDEVQVARLCFLAFLHDLGKCNWGFQRKILPEVTERAGHVSEVGALLLDERLSRAFEAVLPVADMADWMEDEGLLPLFVAVISHHRRQLRVTDGNMAIPCDSSFRRLWEPAHGHRPLNDVRSVIAAARSTFARSFETGGTRIPSNAAFQHAFCGLLMLADWIGSDERGFPFQEPDEPPREACARVWAADALAPHRARRRTRPSGRAQRRGW